MTFCFYKNALILLPKKAFVKPFNRSMLCWKIEYFGLAAADPNSSVETGNTSTFIFAYENIFFANSNQEHDPLLDT